MINPYAFKYIDYHQIQFSIFISVENQTIVGPALTGDAPTTSEWSAVLLPTNMSYIREFMVYISWYCQGSLLKPAMPSPWWHPNAISYIRLYNCHGTICFICLGENAAKFHDKKVAIILKSQAWWFLWYCVRNVVINNTYMYTTMNSILYLVNCDSSWNTCIYQCEQADPQIWSRWGPTVSIILYIHEIGT